MLRPVNIWRLRVLGSEQQCFPPPTSSSRTSLILVSFEKGASPEPTHPEMTIRRVQGPDTVKRGEPTREGMPHCCGITAAGDHFRGRAGDEEDSRVCAGKGRGVVASFGKHLICDFVFTAGLFTFLCL